MRIPKTRRKEIESIRDEEVDYNDIPELDDSFFQNAELTMPETVDEEIILWFKAHYGEVYLTQISTVLRQYKNAHS